MIRKINKIRDYLIFDNFRWPNDLEDFKDYNLIYGWNGTGKTTISNIFQCLEKGKNIENEDGYFELETENGLLKSSELQNNINIPKIKVFNKSFVEENIFKTTGDVEPIYIIGEVDVLKQKDIDELNKKRTVLENEYNKHKDKLENFEKEFDDLCTNQARNIKNTLSGKGELRYINYDKSKFKSKCYELNNRKNHVYEVLDSEKVNELLITIHSTTKNRLQPVNLNDLDIDQIKIKISSLTEETVVSKVIERFKEDSKLNQWAREGLEIHKKKSAKICNFCGRELPKNLIKELEDHFNVEYENFILKIDSQISELNNFIKSANLLEDKMPHKDSLYDEFSIEYEQRKTELEIEINIYCNFLASMIEILESKRSNPFRFPEIEIDIPEIEIEEKLNKFNDLITKHNIKTNYFEKEKEEAKTMIEESYVAEIIEKYNSKKEIIQELKESIDNLNVQIEVVKSRIGILESEISGHSKSADEINQKLSSYLGHEDIKLEAKEKGYIITIRGKEIDTISEGEKTAVAFTYFLETLKEQGFNLEDSIIVIDDPVSSLDSNLLFHAFGLMKENIKKAKQIFILTHNFTFFRQVKIWFNYVDERSRLPNAVFYMLKNSYSNNLRIGVIDKLDNLLKEYESEYHYLFKQVCKFSERKDKDLEFYYHLPNIARRLLELFLAFKKPKGKNLYDKIDKMKCDKVKKERIYRFIQTHSHGEYIEDSSEHDLSILGETPDVLKDILEAIEMEDEEHYNQMIEIVNNQ